jgi:hypothetical protein
MKKQTQLRDQKAVLLLLETAIVRSALREATSVVERKGGEERKREVMMRGAETKGGRRGDRKSNHRRHRV